ncbi:response regulator [bacterium]|nr:response regulator [bacterium]
MKRQVLVVDDDPQIYSLVRKILSKINVESISAESGQDALKKLRSGFRGLILMDVNMPEMNGWDTIEKIIEQELMQGNLIFMLTGDIIPEARMDYLKEYVLDYITKPFTAESLSNLVLGYFEDFYDNFDTTD